MTLAQAISIPKLGLTMESGTVVEWHVPDGGQVARGDVLVTIETDKIASEIEAEQDGFLQQVAPLEATLPVGGLLGYLHASAEAALAAGRPGDAAIADGPAAPLPVATAAPAGDSRHPAALGLTLPGAGQRLMVSPVARRIAETTGVDLPGLTGTGPGGVILKRDVEAAAARRPPAAAPPAAPQAEVASAVAGPAAPARPDTPDDPAVAARRPLSGSRKVISQRMMHSLATTAQMTGFGKIDMAETVRLRRAWVAAADQLGARITYTDILLKAAALVLAEMPGINASIIGEEIVTWRDVHIGLAVALEDGLIVPAIRHADRLSLVEMSLLRQDLIDKARSGRLSRAEVEGGTFTLSNFGSYGGDFETPILNSPQSALLGIGQITDEPVVRQGEIVIRPMMTISLTFDHRLIDGALAGRFRARLKALLEEPALLLALLR